MVRSKPQDDTKISRPQRKYGEFELRDVLSQVGECLQSIGYETTLKALKEEAAEWRVEMDVDLWRRMETDETSGQITSLGDLWRFCYLDKKMPQPSLRTARKSLASKSEAVTFAVPDTLRHAKLEDKISDEASGSSSGSDMMERAAPKGQREETPLASESESSDSESDADAGAKKHDDSNSDSSSDSGSESRASEASAKAGEKRKRVMTPDSSDDSSSDSGSEAADGVEDDANMASDSESNSDSSSSDSDDSRPAKRTKLAKGDKSSGSGSGSDSSSSDSDSSSSSGSSSAKKKAAKKTKKTSSRSSSSDSDSDSSSSASNKSGSSSSDSSSDSSSNSSSDSSSDSDSESSESPSSKKKTKKEKKQPKSIERLQVPKIERTGSATSSSATLEATSPVRPKIEKASDTLLVHDADEGHKELPATKENIKKLKKDQVPFSRIPADTKIDPKFASNAYVPYDYANRAYQDLSVTKGKGFTKEKNKKKRGAYRGGAIDLAPKAIKFED